MSRSNGDQRFQRIPTRAEKVRVPVWMLVAAVAGKGLWLAARGCWRHRGTVAATVGVLLFVHRFGLLGLGLLLGGLALVTAGYMAGRSGP